MIISLSSAIKYVTLPDITNKSFRCIRELALYSMKDGFHIYATFYGHTALLTQLDHFRRFGIDGIMCDKL